MITFSAPLAAALANPTVPLLQLVKFNFTPTPICLNSSNRDYEHGGLTYKGAYGYGSIAVVEDSPGEVKGLTFMLNGAPASMVALALDDSDLWQGVVVTVSTAVLGSDYQIAGVQVDWTGYGDVMSIAEDGETCAISATAESSAVDMMRSSPLTYSHADQLSIYPTDNAFQYVVDQVSDPVVWPAKEWFYK